MGLVDVPELRELQQLAGTVGEHLVLPALLQKLGGIFHHLVQQQKPLAADLIRQVHQVGIHVCRTDARKVGVQQVADLRQRLRLQRQAQRHQTAFHPAVRQHHHRDHRRRVHGDQLEPAHRGVGGVIRHRVGGVVHKAGHHLARLGDHLVGALQLLLQGAVDLGGLFVGDGFALHQLVDVQPVAKRGGDPPGAGVGLL